MCIRDSSSTATDLLVAFGVASIKLGVVIKYAVPLIVLVVAGIILTVVMVFYLGRRLHRKDWFEKLSLIHIFTSAGNHRHCDSHRGHYEKAT